MEKIKRFVLITAFVIAAATSMYWMWFVMLLVPLAIMLGLPVLVIFIYARALHRIIFLSVDGVSNVTLRRMPKPYRYEFKIVRNFLTCLILTFILFMPDAMACEQEPIVVTSIVTAMNAEEALSKVDDSLRESGYSRYIVTGYSEKADQIKIESTVQLEIYD